MSNLSNQYISSSYQSVLNIGTISGSSLSGTLQPVTDGFGQQTPISISSTKVGINGDLLMTGSIIPQGSGSFDLGSPTNPFRHGYFSSGSIYLDDHQVLTLSDAATNTAIKAPPNGTLQLLNNIVFASDTTDSVGGQFTMQGAGPNNQTQTLYTGSYHFINNDGYLAWLNKVPGSESTGSFNFGLQDGGNFNIENKGGGYTRIKSIDNSVTSLEYAQTDGGPTTKTISLGQGSIFIENTEAGDSINIHNNSGSIILDAFKFVSGAFVEANNINMYGDKIVIDANYISSSAAFLGDTSFSGSITLSGTLYPGQIDVSQGGIVETTGSYVATFTNGGIMTYDTYQNVATALNPYITGSTINTGSFATTGSNTFIGNQTVSGSINLSGSIDIGNFAGDYYGTNISVDNTTSTYASYGTDYANFNFGVYDSGYDNELFIGANSSEVSFSDWNNSTNSYSQWLRTIPNDGSNPAPQMVRGLGITGSLTVSGSLNVKGDINTTNIVNSITGRTMVYGGNGGSGATPRLYVSGSDGGFVEIGRSFISVDTTNVNGLNNNINAYASPVSNSSLSIGVFTPNTFDDDYELNIVTSTGGTQFQDFDNFNTFNYQDFLVIPPNVGNSPIPQFTRGLGITGSLSVTGGLYYSSGSNKTMGTVALNGGNPGVATVSNSLVTSNSLIFLTKQTNTHSGNGTVSVTSKGAGTFSITSNHNGDNDVVAYQIINPA
jgi:hypothetical protein